ncbi:uncharacterized protein LOC123292882 [Chrysoperla carnea]|uniref:uncharacterized protein LOC123292882 n=1 Tax=Chrysoperla carnea TaxID=189513 RepID=UPI001D076D95|nr:uncharacterized protein LOC123292882 [Chrysoperla carnea]
MTREQSLKRELSQYEGLKQMYFLQIQRIHGYTKLLNDQSVLKTFLAEYTTVNEIMSEIKDVVMKINDINLQLDEAYEVNYQTISSSQQLVGHINAAYNEVKPQTSVPTTSSNMTPVLPKIVLPTFDGSKKHWPVFWETFQSLIDNNRSLDDNSKVNYLLSALRGHALEMCTGIIPTAANYQIIKDLLKERFEDKRLLMDTYLSQLLNFKQSKLESAAHLNSFLEVFDTSVTALKNLKIDDLLDYVLVFIALSKLDCETRKFFEMSLKGNTLPTYSGFISFIKGHIRTLCNSSSSDAYKVKTQTPSAKTISINPQKSAKSTHSFVAKKEDIFKCPACTQRVSHSIYRCSQFRKLSPQERYKIVMDKSLCLNCLSDKHKINVCRSENLCSVCKSKHHTMLHFDNTKSFNSKTSEDNSSIDVLNVDEKSKTNTNVTACSAVRNIVVTKTVLLSTAIVNVQDKFGNIHKLRFLLDSASQSNFITSECCQVLNLPIVKVFTSVIGIGSHTKSVRGQTNILVSSRFDPTKCYPLECLVIDKITNQLPSTNIDITSFEHLKDLCLADETFHVPSTIHGIIGASMFAQLLGTAKVIGPSLSPIAVHTPLGYVVMGEVPTCSDTTTTQNFYAITTPVESLVKRFWELEEVPESSSPNPEDMECEKIFTSTITRESSGRYTVCLPFKENPQRLGDSYNMARKRFFNLEKRFQTEPSLKETYSSVIHDYIQQNHMTLVPLNDVTSPNYFIPHHCVRKVDSPTTPLRVVFDSSAKSSTSVSLNELLHTGPKLQSDLQQILLNFRLYSIAMTADIKQMYRQINICKEHRKFQLILWRDSPELPLSVYSLNTVSFGVKPSPYLAIRTVQQLAKDEAANYPLASAVATRDFYVDDLVCSVADIKSAVTLHKQMVELFLAGGFPLVKWCSNSPELLHHIPENLRSSQSITFDTESLKILGLNWNPRADMFSFNTDISTGKCSKRNILSAVARMFDPLGFVSPVVLFAKNLIKELWKRKLNWDDEAPLPIQNSWKKFIDELHLLEQFNVPRHLQINLKSQIVLIGFADASETAYGACIYFRTINDEKVVAFDDLYPAFSKTYSKEK